MIWVNCIEPITVQQLLLHEKQLARTMPELLAGYANLASGGRVTRKRFEQSMGRGSTGGSEGKYSAEILAASFEQLDTDNDGLISFDELRRAHKSAGIAIDLIVTVIALSGHWMHPVLSATMQQ